MRFSAHLCALASGVLAAPAQVDSGISVDVPTTDYDAVIVGGGPAGLSALSALARVRRNVLMVDSGEYRNQPTRHMHDVIGFDGPLLLIPFPTTCTVANSCRRRYAGVLPLGGP